MRKIEDIHELRSIQLNILKEIHRFCEKSGVTYFLSSGTLIGAVRHKGYIPWDDDIDVYMPRASYDRFLKTYCDETGKYVILDPSKTTDYYYTFAKLADSRTMMVENETPGFKIGVFVDIFPIDFISDNPDEQERIFKRKRLLYKIRRCKISRHNPLGSRLAYLCYKYLPLSVKQLDKMISRLIISNTETNTVCNLTEAGPVTTQGCFAAKDIATAVDIEFEGLMLKTMAGYVDYLTHTYGDYMRLPPVEERVTHEFEAYRLD